MPRYRVHLTVELDGTDFEQANDRLFWAIANDVETANIEVTGGEHIEATRRCDNCGRTVDTKNLEGCPFCGIAWDDDNDN